MNFVKLSLATMTTCTFLAAARAEVECCVTAVNPTNELMYDNILIGVSMKSNVQTDRDGHYIIVNKEGSKATEIDRADFLKHRKAGDIKNFDGQTLVVCQTTDRENDCGVSFREISSAGETKLHHGSTTWASVGTRPITVFAGDHSYVITCSKKK